MTRNELAISLGYKNEEEWDEKLSNPEYLKYLSIANKFLGFCYSIGSGNCSKERYDKYLKELEEYE